jgi:diadenosine tetraphosphate (Ap4A) HIT family hydrolase/5-methylcytosine-specific restriction endonuclease McrA
MLLTLLEKGGTATQEDIAKAILANDLSQIEYYETITNQMVGRVLRNHGVVTKEVHTYSLAGFERLSSEEIQKLQSLCLTKLEEFIANRGKAIWQHRRKSEGYVSGTLKYEVLKRAKFRCELCGIPAEEKALEVDHIVPRNHGGSDELINLQALCYSCNAMKRDRDDTDFRAVIKSYQHREKSCLFCEVPKERILAENALAYAIRDGYPVVEKHSLVIPKRHVASYFDLGRPEINACNELLAGIKSEILSSDPSVLAFNFGINDGEAAGQTILHSHIHLIPRRKGDVEEPRGGVRHMIPGKGLY